MFLREKFVNPRRFARTWFAPKPRPCLHSTLPHRFVSALSLLLICSLLLPLDLPAQQQQDNTDTGEQPQEHRPLGSLTSTGEVYVNSVHATADMTVFTGDTMLTGADGSGTFTIGGQGSIKASANTELDFSANPLFVAELKSGMVMMSTIPGAPNMKVRAGSFVVVAETGDADTTAAQTACQIEHLADGSFQITSVSGSVGVIALEGPETVFIKAGESVSVNPSGQLSQTTLGAVPGAVDATPDQTTTPQNRKKKVPAGWILLGVVAAGGAGAAAALAGHGSGSTVVSPNSP
jgi:hypothetical protein